MCGITGIFAFNSIGRINLVHLEAATRALEKRGPDAHNSWFDERVGLGHRRLSIIDTSTAANQPMIDASGQYHIIFNGEIYNFKELKNELTIKGCTFNTTSDTEVLLYAYITWGEAMLSKLNGFFAFAIYNEQDRSLFLARDRFGIKPLLYYHDDDKFLFASEMKSLMTYGIDRQLDLESLNLYFQLTYIPSPKSIFKGVKKLKPGFSLLVKDRSVTEKKYYKFPYPQQPVYHSLESTKPVLEQTLRKAVQDRLVSDVPLGAFLSGGIDSSVIVALASEKVSSLNTFSIGFKDNKYFDETRYAHLVAEKYQTNHQTFSLSNDDLLQGVGKVMDYIDEPFADSSALPVHILSMHTRKHVTVALSGDGADEIFSGYNKHSAWLMCQQGGLKNEFIKGFSPLWKALPKSRNSPLTDAIRKLDRFAKAAKMSPKDRYWFLASFVEKARVDRLLKKAFNTDSEAFKTNILSSMSSGSLNEVLALDAQLVLQGDMLQKVDLMSMANGLEVRVPFLDPAVVQLSFAMEDGLKAKGSFSKIILRETFKDYLPDELYTRPKHGFEVPLLDWFRKELRSELDQVVFNQARIEAQGIFDWNEISRIKRQLFSYDPGDAHILVWSLYVFQNWYKKYFD
ncbi:MAG: asparagine synthase (glutamine-hydrolyzing) [Marinoscillum sp.]